MDTFAKFASWPITAACRPIKSPNNKCEPTFCISRTNESSPRVETGLFFLLQFVPRERPESLPALRCEHCGGESKLVKIVLYNGRVLWSHRQPFLDSG